MDEGAKRSSKKTEEKKMRAYRKYGFSVVFCIIILLQANAFSVSAQKDTTNVEKPKRAFLIDRNAQPEEDNKPKTVKPTKPKRNPIKEAAELENKVVIEELQRFLGYENPLLARYLSMPYDVTINTNVKGYHVEIGYLLLMFLPILLIVGLRTRPFLGVIVMTFSTLLVVIATSTSYLLSKSALVMKSNVPNMDRYLARTTFDEAPVGVVTAHFYRFFIKLYEPIKSFFVMISGSKDSVTYPVLIALFVLFFFILQSRIKDHVLMVRTTINMFCLYWFLWAILSGGIVWYGYLILPIGILLLLGVAERYKRQGNTTQKTVFGAIMFSVLIWIGLIFVVRVSDINQLNRDAGKYLFDSAIIKYQTGVFSEKDVFDAYLNNVNNALDQINNDESLIYRAGTAFSFFIKKNDKRVLNDNLFGMFQNLVNKYKTKQKITGVLKASGFKYLIVDLNAASYDKTPNKSIQKKFNRFFEFLKNNDNLELLATNRVVKIKGQNGKNDVLTNDVFGEKIVAPGSYAVFQIK